MDISSRRRSGVPTSVVAGSVWESRMKSDEVKCGIFKSFDLEDDDNNNTNSDRNESAEAIEKNPADENFKNEVSLVLAVSGKRKTWRSENSDEKNQIQIARSKTDQSEDQCKKTPVKVTKPRFGFKNSSEISVSADGIKKSPVQTKKGRSEAAQVVKKGKSGSGEGNEKSSPVQVKKGRSSEPVEEKMPIRIRKLRSEISKGPSELSRDVVKSDDKTESNSDQLEKGEPEPVKADSDQTIKISDEVEGKAVAEAEPEPKEDKDESVEENEKSPDEIKEFGVCEEKIISSCEKNSKIDEKIDDVEEEEEEEEEEETEEKIVSSCVSNLKIDEKIVDGEEEEETEEFEDDNEEEVDEEIEVEKKSIDVKMVDVIKQKPLPANSNKIRITNEGKRFHQFKERIAPSSPKVNKLPPPVSKRTTAVYSTPTKPSPSKVSDEHQNFPQTQSKLQSLVDLMMWRDISKSALIFGVGTFIIISSSYTSDLNFSIISVISYLGLVYLAAIFFHRSVICRGFIEMNDSSYLVGEEEAVWLMRLILPYLNEFLLRLKALFSGDPATTMKMAVLLFVLARCGSSITIWKMAKLGFFGVFTIPKFCSSYSAQLTAYAKFWIRRFRDAWDSCAHKKAVAFVVFTVVWNMSSVAARVWAAFMLFVAFRYYQQKLMASSGSAEDGVMKVGESSSEQGEIRKHRPQLNSVPNNVNIVLPNKLKKRY